MTADLMSWCRSSDFLPRDGETPSRPVTLANMDPWRMSPAPAGWLLLGAMLATAPVRAEDIPNPPTKEGKLFSVLYEGNVHLGKVSSRLLEVRHRTRLGASVIRAQGLESALPARGGRLDIDVRLSSLTPEVLSRLENAGLQPGEVHFRYRRVSGVADAESLDEIAALPEVSAIHANEPPVRRAGAVPSQADESLGAAPARSSFGVDGSGTEVGVLSSSFNDVIGGNAAGSGCSRVVTGSDPQLSGDLPAEVTVLDNGPGSGNDEGAALGELIHDLAPGASIMFHSAFWSIANMAEGIGELKDCGAVVVVDDVIYFAEPMFQDGIIAQAAADAVDAGVTYVTSAGNEAMLGVNQSYRDANPGRDDQQIPPSGDDFQDFGAGDRFGAVTVPPGCGVQLVLQWNEPFSGTLGLGASSDLDFYLCLSPSPGNCPFLSATVQGCGFGAGMVGGDPLEIVGVINQGTGPATIYTAVEHYCGNEQAHFRIVPFPIGEGCGLTAGYTFESRMFNASTVYGHAAASEVLTVAAAFYGEIEESGDLQSPAGVINVEPFSSRGGDLPFYFNELGERLAGAPVMRFKPDLSAPDGINNTSLGRDIQYDADAFPNLFGTSAAAANAAGAAALVLDYRQAFRPPT